MKLPLTHLFMPFSLFSLYQCLSLLVIEHPLADSWVDYSSTRPDETHSKPQTHNQQIYPERNRSPVLPKLIAVIRTPESRTALKDTNTPELELQSFWDISGTPGTNFQNTPSFGPNPISGQSPVFHPSNLPEAGSISFQRRQSLEHLQKRAVRPDHADFGTSDTSIASSTHTTLPTSSITQIPAPISVSSAQAMKTPTSSLVSSSVKAQNNHPKTDSAQPTGLPNVTDTVSSTPAPPAPSDGPHRSITSLLGQYYQSSFRLHGLTIAITIAFGLVFLLIVISFAKCICHKPKFANVKDYPNGFPWEDRTMASSKGQSRTKPSALSGKGASPFTNTAEGDWDRLDGGTPTITSGYQLSQMSNANTPNITTEAYGFPDVPKRNPTTWVEFDSSNKEDLRRQAELERTWCSPAIGFSSSSSATDESAQVTPIEGKPDGYQWNPYPRAPGSLYVRGEEDPYMTRAGSYQFSANQSSELLTSEGSSRNSWSKQSFIPK